MFAGVALHLQEQYKLIKPYLDRYKAPPGGAGVAARDLTQEQARDLVIHHFHNQELSLEKWPEFDVQGNPTYPKPKEKIKMTYNIGGVNFVADNPAARSWEYTKKVDLRLAVFLVRIAKWLKSEWGATVIHWGGIGVGRSATDQHGQGYALDFHGAVTQHGNFNVYRDWGAKPVPASIGGNRSGKWPATTTNTNYRLAFEPGDYQRLFNTNLSPEFFEAFYKYITTQARHGSSEATPRIGERSYILHPDTPTPSLRSSHQDHIHMEIDQ